MLLGIGRLEFGRAQLEIIHGGGDCQTGFERERIDLMEEGRGDGEEGACCCIRLRTLGASWRIGLAGKGGCLIPLAGRPPAFV